MAERYPNAHKVTHARKTEICVKKLIFDLIPGLASWTKTLVVFKHPICTKIFVHKQNLKVELNIFLSLILKNIFGKYFNNKKQNF